MTGSSLVAASAFGSFHDALNSPAVDVARNLAIFLAVVFWLGLAFWTNRDARRRTEDPLLVGTATALGLVPYLGPVIYLLFRPPERLADVRERELGILALEERLGEHALHCPACRAEVETDFRVCPVCTTRLKQACAQCAAPLERLWQVCPYCAATAVANELVAPELDATLAAQAIARGNDPARALRPN